MNEEALSWRILTEIVRRKPDDLWIIERHPAGGTYDCLSLVSSNTSTVLVDVNRGGSIHFDMQLNDRESAPMPHDRWLTEAAVTPHTLVQRIANLVAINDPKRLPSSTPRAVAYRVVSEILSLQIGRALPWRCLNGFEDTSGYGAGPREHLFQQVPTLKDRTDRRPTEYPLDDPDYAYWFLVADKTVRVAIDTDARLYRPDGKVFDMMESYHRHHKLWRAIVEMIGDKLP